MKSEEIIRLFGKLKSRLAAGPRGETDSRRLWASMEGLEWEERAKIAATWLNGSECVVDIGCGAMTLRRLLPLETRYIPVDLVLRSENTIVVDLNAQGLPDFEAEAASLLGVLEYVTDAERLVKQLRQFRRVVLSYNHKHFLRNKSHPWVNNFSVSELAAMLKAAGFTVVKRQRIRLAESIYLLT